MKSDIQLPANFTGENKKLKTEFTNVRRNLFQLYVM